MFQPTLFFRNVTLLSAAGPLGHSIRLRGAKIMAINGQPQQKDHLIDGGGGLVLPGLINAHDHLELNTFKRLKYRERYSHSRQWIEDIEARFETNPELIEPRRQPLADRLWVSAAKNLLSGVTTVCHHNPLHQSLRRNYPIEVVKKYGFGHSLFRGENLRESYRRTKRAWPWIIHLAEGVDAEAQTEFEQLDRLGLVQPNTLVVHGVGLTAGQRQTLMERGGGLIWCPGSNRFMFGQTAQVRELALAGKLALGSDSRLSGEFDLLAELRVAHQTGQLEPQSLFDLVTAQAAQLLRLGEGQGRLVEGGRADLVLLPAANTVNPFAALLNMNRAEIKLVMVGGRPLVGSPEMEAVFSATKTRVTLVWLDGVEKLMAQKFATRLRQGAVQEPGLTINHD